MCEEAERLARREMGQARTDIANVEIGLEMIMAQIARLRKQGDLARAAAGAALVGMLGGACLVECLALLFR